MIDFVLNSFPTCILLNNWVSYKIIRKMVGCQGSYIGMKMILKKKYDIIS